MTIQTKLGEYKKKIEIFDILERREQKKRELTLKYGLSSLPVELRAKEMKEVYIDTGDFDINAYKIKLGKEERWNIAQYLTDDEVPLRGFGGFPPQFSLIFSAKVSDSDGLLQSEHCYFGGGTGMGKTNLSSLFAVGFHKRPNPSSIIWFSQKQGTVDTDMRLVGNVLKSQNKKTVFIDFEKDNPMGKIPIDILNLDEISILFNFKGGDVRAFSSIYEQTGMLEGTMKTAIKEFIKTPQGQIYAPQYNGLVDGNIFSFKKSDDMKITNNTTFLVSLTGIYRKNKSIVDIIISAYMRYFYREISLNNQTVRLNTLIPKEKKYLKQHQGIILFDEFFELTNKFKGKKSNTLDTATEIASQGRSEGTSLILATQTTSNAGAAKDVYNQSSYIMQFKTTYQTDINFITRVLGMATSKYMRLATELFLRIFPFAGGENPRGRIILFAKEPINGNESRIKCIKLSLFSELEEKVMVSIKGEEL